MISLALLLVAPGCADDSKKACPEGGLGITTSDGTLCSGILDPLSEKVAECQEQMREYVDYDCAEPQICPDHGAHQIPFYILAPSTAPEELTFTLTNCSTGGKPLVIEKVEITGDPRCHFTFNPETDIQPSLEIKPGETGFIRAVYDPQALGEDHGQIRIYSNAQNFPLLVLPICAWANPEPAGTGDAGVTGTDLMVEIPACKDVGDTIEPCHQN
jgi:hypothetical protein